jgi:hypothetical protein
MAMIQLALVVETQRIPRGVVTEVAAAVQRQITRDLAPIWNVEATIDPFATLRDVPPGYWPIIVRDEFEGMNIIGIHLDEKGQPFALVRNNPTWSLTVSHEALEMITDPWGNRLVPGGSPMPGQGLIELLVEICDPPGGVAHAYTVNGHLVSDFVLPSYYDPVAVAGERYSFAGAISRPRDIAGGGYLAWRDPVSDEWWAWDWVNRPRPTFRSLGRLSDPTKPLRQQVDAQTINTELGTGAPVDHPNVRAAAERLASSRLASGADARRLQAFISDLISTERRRQPGPGPSPGGSQWVARAPRSRAALPPEEPEQPPDDVGSG